MLYNSQFYNANEKKGWQKVRKKIAIIKINATRERETIKIIDGGKKIVIAAAKKYNCIYQGLPLV